MKRILLPELGTKYLYVLDNDKFGPFKKDQVVFAYDGLDLIAWLWVQEIDENNNQVTLLLLDSSISGE